MVSVSTDRRLGLSGNVAAKAPVDIATTTNITLYGEQTIQSVTTDESRVLVAGQTDATTNGIYDTSSGAWTRAIDANGVYDLKRGTVIRVTQGTYTGLFFEVTTANPITIGTSSIEFTPTMQDGYSYLVDYAFGTPGLKLNSMGVWAVADLNMDKTGADGSGNLTKLQAALTAGYIVHCEPGLFALSGAVVLVDGSGIIGSAAAHFDRRSGYDYNAAQQTIFKYTGAGGANSCVIRASEKAVGTVGSDFTTPGTDDLIDIVLENIHIDGNSLAEYPFYMYRVGGGSRVGNITVEKGIEYNVVGLGLYAVKLGPIGSFNAVKHGVAIGWDIFAWSSVEATCFALEADFQLVGNGTSHTYVAGTGTDLDNSGGKFSVGRGSKIRIDSEGNYGRSCLLSQYNIASGTGGPTEYELSYVEGNGSGPYIDYRDGMDGISLGIGLLHPGNGGSLAPQNIKIEGKNNSGVVTADSGPANRFEWLVIERAFGDLAGTAAEVDSNTGKYVMRDCPVDKFTFANRKPLTDDFISSDRQVTASVHFLAASSTTPTVYAYQNGTLTRSSAGTYVFTYDRAFRTAGAYVPHVTNPVSTSGTLTNFVKCTNLTTAAATIVTYTSTGGSTDTNDRISFTISGLLT